MASDLSVPKVGATATAVEPGRVRVAGQPPRLATVSAPPADVAPDTGKPMANPTLRLDPGLALVVIEFRDGAGKVALRAFTSVGSRLHGGASRVGHKRRLPAQRRCS